MPCCGGLVEERQEGVRYHYHTKRVSADIWLPGHAKAITTKENEENDAFLYLWECPRNESCARAITDDLLMVY